jgi:hypothetical protein
MWLTRGLGCRSSSIKYLEAFYEVALTTGELTAQREACGRLGVIFNSAGDYASSVSGASAREGTALLRV